MAQQRSGVRFRALDSAEMDALLARNHVGRIAFAFRDQVDIEPIHYVYRNGVIHCRTAPGTKLTTLAHRPWVAFEVDEVEGFYDWRSVVARGSVYVLDEQGSEKDQRDRAEAVALMREVLPEVFTPEDRAPFRQVVLRIYPDQITGREAGPAT